MKDKSTSVSYSLRASGSAEPAAQLEALSWSLPQALVWGQKRKHFQMAFKRIIDVVAASILIVLFAIPLIVVAIAIKLDSPGPVFYPHYRVGQNGRRFRMFKFRSMYVDAEKVKEGLLEKNETDAPLFKMKHDPRRTRVGGVIRRFSIDEFPQLLNVWMGQMSLVGPRPALPEEAELYSDSDAFRVIAVPGMTGLWQVSGRSLLTFDQMVELDVKYASEWSVWLDIFILFKTIPVIVGGKGAY
jgi:lipopolysaccharide/colanic/teichoic acid biosynthesis glycosyltransferase